MSQLIDDYISIVLKFPLRSEVNYLGRKGLIPLLQLLENSNFPKPIGMEFYGKSRNQMRKRKLHSYQDPFLLSILEPVGRTGTHISLDATSKADALFHLYISQTGVGDQLVFNIGAGIVEALKPEGLKTFFLELLHFFPQVYLAQCFFSGGYRQYYWNSIEGKYKRHRMMECLVGLQYISSQELTLQGGKTHFEQNPFLKTNPLQDGLLVEIGESPYDIFTDEGKELLLKATLSLPPIQN